MKRIDKEKKLNGKKIIKIKDKYIVFNNENITNERRDILRRKYE